MTAQTTFPTATGSEIFFKLAFAIGVVVAGLEIGYLLYSPIPMIRSAISSAATS